MTKDQANSVDVLNRLYAAECASLLARLADLDCFVSGQAAWQVELLRRLCTESAEHRVCLVEAVENCGGAVRPATLDPRTASLHYVSLDSLLPRIRDGIASLVAEYDRARHQGLLTPETASLIAWIAARYDHELKELDRPVSA